MDMTPCARCAGTVAPDGHCWNCGLAQTDFRAHVESTVDGAAFVTDRGSRRAVNADAVVLTTAGDWTVGVVCDGVSLSARPERRLPDEGPGLLLTEDDTGEHDALTAWLGADAPDPRPRLRSHRPSCSGRVLLCTDGLSRYLADPAELRAAAGPGDSLHAARALVGHALAAGGHDNVTATLIPVPPPRPAVPGTAAPPR